MNEVLKAKANLQEDIKTDEETFNQVQDDRYQKDKKWLLIKLGLYEKEYMAENANPKTYPETESSEKPLEDSEKGME